MIIPATYSFLDVHVAISGPGGAFALGSGSGNSEEGVVIRMAEEKNLMTIGADGTPMNSLRAGNSGTIEVNLLKTSPVNAQLSDLYNFQKSSSANWGQNVITFTNITTGDAATGQACSFKKLPDSTNTKDGGHNTWLFDAGILDQNLAGLI